VEEHEGGVGSGERRPDLGSGDTVRRQSGLCRRSVRSQCVCRSKPSLLVCICTSPTLVVALVRKHTRRLCF
jgi:hypothetical protein